MSGRDSIERRMETIRAARGEKGQRAREVEAHRQAKRETREARVAEMERYAGKFARWARRNRIPFDYHSKALRRGGRWILASFSTDGGRTEKSSGSLHNLYINRRGKIQPPLGHPVSDERAAAHTARFSPDDVEQRIAELCLDHGLKAPNI